MPLEIGNRMQLLPDGSLLLKDAQEEDNGKYTCHVENQLGADEVTYTVIVQAVPGVMLVEISLISTDSIDVQWKPGSDGGSAILGYELHVQYDDQHWKLIEVDPIMDNYRLDGLQCGAKYHIYMLAVNKIGKGKPSAILTIATKGGIPIHPMKENLIEEGSTFATINLDSWITDKCSIKYFIIEYKPITSPDWLLFSDELKPEKRKVVMSDLSPATWYNLRMIAHSTAGSTAKEYLFATLTLEGATLVPDIMSDEAPVRHLSIALDLKIMLVVAAILVVIFAVALVTCVCLKSKPPKKSRGRKRISLPREFQDGMSDIYNDDYGPGSDGYTSIPRRTLKKGDLAPYATAHLNDFQPQESCNFDPRSNIMSMGNDLPGMIVPFYPQGNRNSAVNPRNLHSVIQQERYPTAPPMSVSYGMNSAEYPEVSIRDGKVPEAMNHGIFSMEQFSESRKIRPAEEKMETTFIFPTTKK